MTRHHFDEALARANAKVLAYNARIDRALETGYLAGLTAADPDEPAYDLTEDGRYQNGPGRECAGCWHRYYAEDLVRYDDEHYCADCEPTLHAIVYHPTNKENNQ